MPLPPVGPTAPVPVATIAITPSSASLQVGATQQLSATVKDASGATLTDRSITWSSSAASIATVSSTGSVTAIAAGTALITATREGKTANAAITVTAPTQPALRDAGAYGVVRNISSNGQAAPAADCLTSDGNQGFRIDKTFTVDPTNAQHLYVAIEFDGFFVSTNGGATWQRSSSGLIGYPRMDDPTHPCLNEMADLAIDPNDPQHLVMSRAGEPGTITDVISENNGLYETKNGGATWRQILTKPGLGIYVHDGVAIAPNDSKTIYAGTTTNPRGLDGSNRVYPTVGLVYRTRDGGATWDELPTGVADNAGVQGVFVAATDPSAITVFTIGRTKNPGSESTFGPGLGTIRTTDGGATWRRIDSGDNSYNSVSVARGSPSHVVAVTFSGTVQVSSDGGATFTRATFNGAPLIVALDPRDATGLTGLAGDFTGNIFTTANGGASWIAAGRIPQQAALSPRVTKLEFGPDGAWYAAGHFTGQENGKPKQVAFVYKSTDRGTSWVKILDGAAMPK